MRISIVTDIHHGRESRTCSDLRDPAWPVLEAVGRFVDRAGGGGYDAIIDLGDRIADFDRESDLHHLSELAAIFGRFDGERVHILGNHDIVNLTVADNADTLASSAASRVVDLGSARLIAWQPGVSFDYRSGTFERASQQLDWLIDALVQDDRPAIIATHVSFAGRTQTGNYYHHHAPSYSAHPDHHEVRVAVENTGRAALWLSGHSHWNTWSNISNIHHITIQSLTERFTTYPNTAGAYADLTIEDDQFTLDVHGHDPLHIRLPFRRSGDRPWVAPMLRTPAV